METLADRLRTVRERIARAAERARRDPAAILLLAVTKVVPRRRHPRGVRPGAARVRRELRAGIRRQGAATRRILPDARFHLIGHLQSNKIEKGGGAFPGGPDRRFAQAGAPPERVAGAARRDAGSEALPRGGEERRRAGGTAGTDRRGAVVRESAAAGADDHAAVVGRSRSVARPYFRRLRELARRAWSWRSFRWGCRTTWRRPSKKGRPACAWARRCSAGGRSRDRRLSMLPLPPARTGVADYAAALLAELKKRGRVQVAASALRGRALPSGQQRPARGDLPSRAGRAGRGGAARRRAAPFPARDNWTKPRTSRSSSTTTANGTAGWRAICGAGARRPAPTGGTSITPCCGAIAERSRAVVVHNPAAARVVTEHAPQARVVEIPHLFARPGRRRPERRRRCAGGSARAWTPAGLLFGVFGYLRESQAADGGAGGLRGSAPRLSEDWRC